MRPEDLGEQYVRHYQRKLQFVAEHIAYGSGRETEPFDKLQQSAREMYLEEAREAIDACDRFDAQNPFPK